MLHAPYDPTSSPPTCARLLTPACLLACAQESERRIKSSSGASASSSIMFDVRETVQILFVNSMLQVC